MDFRNLKLSEGESIIGEGVSTNWAMGPLGRQARSVKLCVTDRKVYFEEYFSGGLATEIPLGDITRFKVGRKMLISPKVTIYYKKNGSEDNAMFADFRAAGKLAGWLSTAGVSEG